MNNKLYKEYPMAKPRDIFYYIEPLFDGKTSEQIFKEKLEKGIIKYIGKKTEVQEEKQYLETMRLGGKPMKFKIKKINIVLYDEYKDGVMTYCRNSQVIASYTPEEWKKLDKSKKKEYEFDERN